MDIAKLERLYKERNLNDYILESEEDLFYIHGIKLDQIDGYGRLNDIERKNFSNFIINFYNAHGVEYRDIAPVRIYVVLEKSYIINTDAIRDFVIRRIVIDEKTKEIEDIWQYERFKDKRGKLKTMERYMRFEYIENGIKTWLHVNKSGGWY